MYGEKKTWNADYCCGYAVKNNIDDITYIDTAIDLITSEIPIDKDNIFLIGFSNGGMMAYKAATLLKHKVKGVVSESSAVSGEQKLPITPFSLLMIQSKDDDVIPYDGTMLFNGKMENISDFQFRPFLPFEDGVAMWKKYLGCEQLHEQKLSNSISLRVADCADNNTMKVLLLDKGGHSWFDHDDVDGISIPKIIMRFMKEAASRQ